MDICVLTEKSIGHGDLLVQAIPIGGLRMIDDNEADDKIIAVMRDDALYGHLTDIAQCPPSVIERAAPLLPDVQARARLAGTHASRSRTSTAAKRRTKRFAQSGGLRCSVHGSGDAQVTLGSQSRL